MTITESVLWSIGTQTVELDIFETFMEKFMSIELVIIIVRIDQSCLARWRGYIKGNVKVNGQRKTLIPWANGFAKHFVVWLRSTKDVGFYVKELRKIGALSFYIVWLHKWCVSIGVHLRWAVDVYWWLSWFPDREGYQQPSVHFNSELRWASDVLRLCNSTHLIKERVGIMGWGLVYMLFRLWLAWVLTSSAFKNGDEITQ